MITRVLRNRFVFNPVLLSAAVKPFTGNRYAIALFDMIQTLMPEHKSRLVKMKPIDAAKEFARLFSRTYFPVQFKVINLQYIDNEYILERFLDQAPIIQRCLRRFDYDQSLSIKPGGQILASVICEQPESCHGSRIVVIDEFRRRMRVQVADNFISMIPETGYSLSFIKSVLGDYPGLIDRCQWLFQRTGNAWLDTRGLSVQWRMDEIEPLAAAWPECQEIERRMADFDTWLEANYELRSSKIISALAAARKTTLSEIFKGDTHV